MIIKIESTLGIKMVIFTMRIALRIEMIIMTKSMIVAPLRVVKLVIREEKTS